MNKNNFNNNPNETIFTYDKTFEGLLCCVFFAFEAKESPTVLLGIDEIKPLFADKSFYITTEEAKAKRVWNGLEKKISKSACEMILTVWLSELQEIDFLLFRYITKAFKATKSIELNFGDEDVLRCAEIFKKVNTARLRMLQFIRFQKTIDGIYFAPVAPDHNVITLAIDHFKERYADQQWIIYDTKRNYGLYYNLKSVTEITFPEDVSPVNKNGKLNTEQLDPQEKLYQQMWKDYFKTMAIKERINLKLQRQHMPARYWKYLTELQ
ncbi:MAG: TIGR03915 family putative DNA repair protein [Paludibacteraceae bacterium]